jgi:hypothetical protein
VLCFYVSRGEQVAHRVGRTKSLISRRQFLARSGTVAGLSVLANVLPTFLKARGWYDPAYAQTPDLVRDTLNGLVAFVLPGDEIYSRAQGEQGGGPGGIEAGATDLLVANLDRYLPTPVLDVAGIPLTVPGVETVPLSAAVANLLDAVALTVNPLPGNLLSSDGLIVSPFARLSMAEKAKVFQELEGLQMPDVFLPEPFTRVSGNLSFLVGIVPAFAGFLASNEAGVFDPKTRTLTARPVSWQISGYQPNGPVEGWDELKGYYQGRKKVGG